MSSTYVCVLKKLHAKYSTKFTDKMLNECFGDTPNTANSPMRMKYGVISRHWITIVPIKVSLDLRGLRRWLFICLSVSIEGNI